MIFKEKHSLGYKINSFLTFQIHQIHYFIPLMHWHLRSQKKKVKSGTETPTDQKHTQKN